MLPDAPALLMGGSAATLSHAEAFLDDRTDGLDQDDHDQHQALEGGLDIDGKAYVVDDEVDRCVGYGAEDDAQQVTAAAGAWYGEGAKLFSKELPSRVISNLGCCYAGLKLVETVCASYRLSWDDVFGIGFGPCVKYLEMGARDYLLDGGTNNRSIVEQTFEIMARMQLDPKNDYQLSEDGTVLYMEGLS